MTLELERVEETEACKVDVPGVGENSASSQTQAAALEGFPKVLNKIAGLWGTRELDKLILELIMDTREGTRQGFPVEVGDELLFLEECNKYVRALDISERMNIGLKKALQMVESGDQAHLTTDPWNDPSVSKDAAFHAKKAPTKSSSPPPYKLEEQRLYGEDTQKKSSSNTLLWIVILAIVLAMAAKFLLPLISK